MNDRLYVESFAEGPGGFFGWISNAAGPKPLEHNSGHLTSRSPWWIDYNHAPPGAGYMHMVFSLNTFGAQGEVYTEVGGINTFISGGYPTNFIDAQVYVTLHGELTTQGAQLLLLIQGRIAGITSGWLLSGQPIPVSKQRVTHSVTLVPDQAQWTALGSRHDRTDMYGIKPLRDVLANVDVNIMLVLFPLDVVPMGGCDGDPHVLRPERDYPVWRHRLPEGYVTLEEFGVQFA
ncbi:MAG: hypothetical protein ABGZ17_07545 [Planctomycetaceae bacterium]